MTPEQINAELAVRVMGWELSGSESFPCWKGPSRPCFPLKDWNPWTDANDVKLVLEKLHDDGWSYEIVQGSGSPNPAVHLYRPAADYRRCDYHASRPFTEAVCIAALRAVGMEVEL